MKINATAIGRRYRKRGIGFQPMEDWPAANAVQLIDDLEAHLPAVPTTIPETLTVTLVNYCRAWYNTGPHAR